MFTDCLVLVWGLFRICLDWFSLTLGFVCGLGLHELHYNRRCYKNEQLLGVHLSQIREN